MYGSFADMYDCAPCKEAHAWCPWRSEKGIESSETGVQMARSLHMGEGASIWDLNLDRL